MKKMIPLILITLLLLSGCNLPTPDEENSADLTRIAQTAAADVFTEMPEPTVMVEATEESRATESVDGESSGQDGQEVSKTPDVTGTPDVQVEIGEGDYAEFIADVTIPDYSEIELGEEITKTWRVRNAGTTTWTTGYLLEFEKGEKLGASTQIPLSEEVVPGEMVDISIDFRVPTATGEYTSYWILKNEENQRVGAGDETEYLSLYMVILAVDEGAEDGDGDDSDDSGSSSGSQSIDGGAKITGASVSVDNPNYQGECPAQLTFSYTVTTANEGKVQFSLVFGVISPSGYKFDPPPQNLVNFSSGYTVYYDYLLFSNDPVTATVRVRAIGENEFLSTPVQFSVKCQ